MNLADWAALAASEQGLVTVATVRADGTVKASLVNAGVLVDPVGEGEVAAFVTYGRAKLANLRARPQLALTVRSGWQWGTVEGTARIVGPHRPPP